MERTFDCLVIGAGYAGAVAARELAERGGKRVLVLERRDHVAGNAYDCLDQNGVLIHQYGPHIFHTASRRVYDWLSRFTQWRDYQHRVLANVHGVYMPVPFNLTSLHMAFPAQQAARLEEKLLAAYGEGARVTILELRENTDPEVRAVADYVYENVFVYYTMKQWGQTPEEIDPATTARVPILLSRDDRYFQDPYQGMPLEGYASMFQKILDHPNITVELGVDARDRLRLEEGAVTVDGAPFAGTVIYTGQVDELFGFRFGRLPYRTLDFGFDAGGRAYRGGRGVRTRLRLRRKLLLYASRVRDVAEIQNRRAWRSALRRGRIHTRLLVDLAADHLWREKSLAQYDARELLLHALARTALNNDRTASGKGCRL